MNDLNVLLQVVLTVVTLWHLFQKDKESPDKSKE